MPAVVEVLRTPRAGRGDVMELRLKRLLPRQFTDWHGRYMIEDDPDERWRPCRVVDVTSLGAGLELFDITPDEMDGQSIVLSFDMRGEVKHGAARTEGMKVGIQFEDLTEAETEYVRSLVELQAHW
jgi:hypothetical protein